MWHVSHHKNLTVEASPHISWQLSRVYNSGTPSKSYKMQWFIISACISGVDPKNMELGKGHNERVYRSWTGMGWGAKVFICVIFKYRTWPPAAYVHSFRFASYLYPIYNHLYINIHNAFETFALRGRLQKGYKSVSVYIHVNKNLKSKYWNTTRLSTISIDAFRDLL